VFQRADYSRTATLDLPTAMAAGLRRLLESVELQSPTGVPVRFSAVFDEWPQAEDNYAPPSACVVPSDLEYSASVMTPALIEDTWEPVGDFGFGLYVVAEAAQDVEVQIRTDTPGLRARVSLAMESIFLEPGLTALGSPSRNGVVIPMPEYFGLPMRVLLLRSRKLDDQESAMHNAWETSYFLRIQARQVVLGRVSPFTVKVQEVVSVDPIA
jgi:hypothetical protein